jgi:hypothetical protein
MGLKIQSNRPAWKPAVTCLVPTCLPPIAGPESTQQPPLARRRAWGNRGPCRFDLDSGQTHAVARTADTRIAHCRRGHAVVPDGCSWNVLRHRSRLSQCPSTASAPRDHSHRGAGRHAYASRSVATAGPGRRATGSTYGCLSPSTRHSRKGQLQRVEHGRCWRLAEENVA